MKLTIGIITLSALSLIAPQTATAWGLDSVSNVVSKTSDAQDKADTAKEAAADPTHAAQKTGEKSAGVYGTVNDAKATTNGVKDDVKTVNSATTSQQPTNPNPRQPASN